MKGIITLSNSKYNCYKIHYNQILILWSEIAKRVIKINTRSCIHKCNAHKVKLVITFKVQYSWRLWPRLGKYLADLFLFSVHFHDDHKNPHVHISSLYPIKNPLSTSFFQLNTKKYYFVCTKWRDYVNKHDYFDKTGRLRGMTFSEISLA